MTSAATGIRWGSGQWQLHGLCAVSVHVHTSGYTYRCADTCPAFTVSTRVQQASDGLNDTHVLSIVTHECRGSRGQGATSVLSTFFHLLVKFACHYIRHVTSTRLVNCLIEYLMNVAKSRFYHSHCFCSPLFSSVYFFHLFLFSPFDWVFSIYRKSFFTKK